MGGLPCCLRYWLSDASEAQRKNAYHAPSLALSGSRPPLGDYLCSWSIQDTSQEFTMVTMYFFFCHPLAQEFTMVLRAGDSLPAERKALGAVEGCSRGLMAGVSPAPPETKARNGAEPLAARQTIPSSPDKL